MFIGALKPNAALKILKLRRTLIKCQRPIIYAFAYLKKAAALANIELGVLPDEKRDAIANVCDEILAGKLDDQFPLVVWQTGSGTQSNMNVNEVMAYRAHVLHGGKLTDKEKFLHPNDDVNKSQSAMILFQQLCILLHIKCWWKQLFPVLKNCAIL